MSNNQIGDSQHAVDQKLDPQAQAALLESKAGASIVANVSRDFRTPLNTIIILAKLLKENAESNLTSKQVEFATVIHDAGSEVLQLVNELLALADEEEKKSIARSSEMESTTN